VNNNHANYAYANAHRSLKYASLKYGIVPIYGEHHRKLLYTPNDDEQIPIGVYGGDNEYNGDNGENGDNEDANDSEDTNDSLNEDNTQYDDDSPPIIQDDMSPPPPAQPENKANTIQNTLLVIPLVLMVVTFVIM
jgi:hypothetical protein